MGPEGPTAKHASVTTELSIRFARVCEHVSRNDLTTLVLGQGFEVRLHSSNCAEAIRNKDFFAESTLVIVRRAHRYHARTVTEERPNLWDPSRKQPHRPTLVPL